MATAAKEEVGDEARRPPAVPPRATPGSAWPGALRIDAELAENHARSMPPPMAPATGGASLLGSRPKVPPASTSTAVKNDLRRNSQAETASRSHDGDTDDAGKDVGSGAGSRIRDSTSWECGPARWR